MLSSFKAVQNMGVFTKYIVSSRAKVSTVLASATCIQSSNSYTSGLPIQKQKSKPNPRHYMFLTLNIPQKASLNPIKNINNLFSNFKRKKENREKEKK